MGYSLCGQLQLLKTGFFAQPLPSCLRECDTRNGALKQRIHQLFLSIKHKLTCMESDSLKIKQYPKKGYYIMNWVPFLQFLCFLTSVLKISFVSFWSSRISLSSKFGHAINFFGGIFMCHTDIFSPKSWRQSNFGQKSHATQTLSTKLRKMEFKDQ